jgi:mono/diheme cytochrome c family protein/cytochrome c553
MSPVWWASLYRQGTIAPLLLHPCRCLLVALLALKRRLTNFRNVRPRTSLGTAMVPGSMRGLLMAAFPAAVLLAAASPAALAQEEPQDVELGPVFLLSVGGKLYDDLWVMLDEDPPARRNPSVSDDLEIDDRATWRCVSCHGWDYKGAVVGNIRYPELRSLEGDDPERIAERIRDPAHPYPGADLPEVAVELLATFISLGQYELSSFVDDDGRATGDAEFGRDIYEGACINCHQLDGRGFLRGDEADRSLGWVARNRPGQALHKILNGAPAAEMLAMRFLATESVADLLAYVQGLDTAAQ